MEKRMVQSTLRLAILGLLSQEALAGYDLRKVFTTTPMGHFSTSPGAIYPALKRMKENGLIRGSIEGRDTLRPRQVFAITSKGRQALKERLLLPITRDDVVWRMDELVLRFAFIGDLLGRARSRIYLKELIAGVEGYLPVLKEHLEVQRRSGRGTGAYALEHGIAHYAATLKWARRVIGELGG
jgi:DNA-binding PadR family transcriptional regulator